MKRYLINGVLALLAGAFVSSCSEKEVDYVPLANQKAQAFDEVFKEVYGEIDPNQNWGFTDGMTMADYESVEPTIVESDSSEIKARTRGTRGQNAYCDVEGKSWADNGFKVPKVVGNAERDSVIAEFSKVHTDLGETINWSDYFIQQVYSCENNQNNKYTTFPDQNGATQQKEAWTQMNQLVCGLYDTHGNNFNSNKDPGKVEVWDGKSYRSDGQKQTYYDEIQLLRNCDTQRFGYHNNLDSKYHYEYIILEINGAYYVGFDFCASYSFKTKNDDGTFVHDKYDQDPGTAKDLNFNGYTPISGDEVVYETEWSHTTQQHEPILDANGNKIIKGYKGGDKDVHRDHIYNDWIIKISPATEQHVPVSGTGSSSRTRTSTTQIWTQLTDQGGRVFCEDLGQATREDLDYNDVVFDVIIWAHQTKTTTTVTNYTWTTTDGVEDPGSRTSTSSTSNNYSPWTYYAQIQLLAAGGTIPLTVQGVEVHNAFSVGVTTMVNTRDGNSTAFGNYVAKDPVYIGNIEKDVTFNGQTYHLKLFQGVEKASDVKIVSSYNGSQVLELKANAGKAPHKLLVPFNTIWTSERKPLNLAYPNFGSYVSGTHDQTWVNNFDSNYLYSQSHKGLSEMPKVIKTQSTTTVSMEVLAQPSLTYTSDFTKSDISLNLAKIGKFYPGDRLRFYGSGFNDDSFISVTLPGDSAPFIDTKFADRDYKTKKYPSFAYIEVFIDEAFCEKLNSKISSKTLTLPVKGRSFKLDQITLVPFD